MKRRVVQLTGRKERAADKKNDRATIVDGWGGREKERVVTGNRANLRRGKGSRHIPLLGSEFECFFFRVPARLFHFGARFRVNGDPTISLHP